MTKRGRLGGFGMLFSRSVNRFVFTMNCAYVQLWVSSLRDFCCAYLLEVSPYPNLEKYLRKKGDYELVLYDFL